MWPSFNSKVFTGAKVNDLCHKWILIDHDIIWFQVSVHDAQLIMEILKPLQYLPHDSSNFCSFIKFNQSFATFLLDIICQTHLHSLEDQV